MLPEPPAFPLQGAHCRLRPWSPDDLASLVRHANSKAVSSQLRDRFPYPYDEAVGRAFIALAAASVPPTALAIEVDGAAIGGTGVIPGQGNERRTAEVGYWLGEAYWGRGIAVDALALVTRYAARTFGLVRLEAFVIDSNQRSRRVLEKAGYQNEGLRRQSFLKDGVIYDQCCYAWVAR
ncbi:MAG: GNAT family N-acetyltransferase [Acidobacteria bacterium]|nr:GNAT family N-acetyltransferase [Acidobacteriota bacterium]